MLKDGYGRVHTNLRLSLTDRCNLRCVYCMPAEPEWMPQPEILTFEEIERLARVGVSLGIRGFRPLKINMVVMKGVNDDEVVDFAEMARTRPWQVRYIEFMPLDGDNLWSRDQVVPAREILDRIHARWPLELESDGPLSDPARI